MDTYLFLKYVPLKKELLIVGSVLFVLTTLPVMAIASLLGSGVEGISNAIATRDAQTHQVTLYNPDGSVKAVLRTLTVWPTTGTVSLEFGADDSPYQKHHTGIDIATPIGTSVEAFMDGTITKAGFDSSEGNYIYIDHGNGIVSRYLHLSSIVATPSSHVQAGEQIGLSGNTGWSTGPHLHFEIRVNAMSVNPRTFISGNPQRG